MVKRLLVALGVVGSGLTVSSPPALADHNFCGSGHGFQYNAVVHETATGTVDAFDSVDFWRDDAALGDVESLRLVTLRPLSGDADLFVWSADCSQLICSSVLGGTEIDSCVAGARGGTYVEVRHYSGSAQYALNVTYSAVFVQ